MTWDGSSRKKPEVAMWFSKSHLLPFPERTGRQGAVRRGLKLESTPRVNFAVLIKVCKMLSVYYCECGGPYLLSCRSVDCVFTGHKAGSVITRSAGGG